MIRVPSSIDQRTQIRAIDANNKQVTKVERADIPERRMDVVQDTGNIKTEAKVVLILLH